ncbi:hypothetical protein PsYK624_111900 [Phanerochaete sordida]|uniref:Uncharacterized protein n=1 Tax=Phanerochaete sordida TaxID=48140 RepID=A0A9P3GHR8_9APHY|nr:hypothetical protein PsYK624_111900 [Phanerochaete sordida]
MPAPAQSSIHTTLRSDYTFHTSTAARVLLCFSTRCESQTRQYSPALHDNAEIVPNTPARAAQLAPRPPACPRNGANDASPQPRHQTPRAAARADWRAVGISTSSTKTSTASATSRRLRASHAFADSGPVVGVAA